METTSQILSNITTRLTGHHTNSGTNSQDAAKQNPAFGANGKQCCSPGKAQPFGSGQRECLGSCPRCTATYEYTTTKPAGVHKGRMLGVSSCGNIRFVIASATQGGKCKPNIGQ